jgi:hypothetical protein
MRLGGHRWRVWQSISGTGPPTVFLPINDQYAREQFDFVTEQLERNGARQKGRVHENTLPKGYLIRDRSWLVEDQANGGIRWAHGFSGEPDLDVGDGQPRLVNHDCRDIPAASHEHHPPRAVPRAKMLDTLVEHDITDQRQQERQDEVSRQTLWFHAPIQTG